MRKAKPPKLSDVALAKMPLDFRIAYHRTRADYYGRKAKKWGRIAIIAAALAITLNVVNLILQLTR